MSLTEHRSPFDCIEVTGIDGAGKSTVSQRLAKYLGWKAAKVRPFEPETVERDVSIREGFGPDASDHYRGCCLGRALLEEASSLGTDTVFDRYIESARMWWHVKGVPPIGENVLARLPQPLLVIHLEIPVGVGLARRQGTSEHSSAEEISFLNACAEYLDHRARQAKNWAVIDATDPLEDVLSRVRHRALESLESAGLIRRS